MKKWYTAQMTVADHIFFSSCAKRSFTERCKFVLAKLRESFCPAAAGHARLVLSKQLEQIYTSLYTHVMSICCIEKYRTLSLAHSDMAVAMAVVFDGGAFYTLLLKVPFIV